jgi:hypothetical protein
VRAIRDLFGRIKPVRFARWQWRSLVERESQYVGSIPGMRSNLAAGIADFSSNFLGFSRDFFFIFANGNSVNELSGGDFDFLRPHFSVGLNAWPLHPFVPSAYAFELWSGLDRHDSELEFLLRRACRKQLTSSSPVWLLRPKRQQVELMSAIMSAVPGLKLDLYGRANLATNSLSQIDREISEALSFLKGYANPGPVLLDNGSSVVRMISLALMHGFRKVILVGVDLTDTPYFWYNPKFARTQGDFTKICRREPDEGTDTLLTRDRPFSAKDFIYALARVAKDQFGAEILVSSGSSALSGELGVFRFGRDNKS